jgi:hypothetical protein
LVALGGALGVLVRPRSACNLGEFMANTNRRDDLITVKA